jgi:hypothetical protein
MFDDSNQLNQIAENIVRESNIPNPVKEVSMEDEQSYRGDTTHNFDQRSSVHSLLSAMQPEKEM